MRLPMLKRGQSLLQRTLYGVMRKVSPEIPGPILVLSYRKEFFGHVFAKLAQHCMRNLRHWSVAEAELFAAFVSKQSACQY